MKPDIRTRFLALIFLFAAYGLSADAATKPEISAQGFSAETPQQALLGNYPRLRVRIEAAGRIQELVIKERSYEVDLAATRDKRNLYLFGLEQPPRSYADVTLDLQNYINERIETEGEYALYILVTDKDDNKTGKTIFLAPYLKVPEQEPSEAPEARLLQSGYFSFKRTGTGPTEGTRSFGIDWQNIDNINVSIGITRPELGSSHLVAMDESDFDTLQTVEQLMEKANSLEKTQSVVLTTARNQAAGEVFLIIDDNKLHLLKVTSSSAYRSKNGTVVIFEGQFKTGDTVE